MSTSPKLYRAITCNFCHRAEIAFAAKGIEIEPVDPLDHRRRIIVLQVGCQQADGGEDAGLFRHQDRRDADGVGERRGMHRTGATESQQGALTPVDTAFHCHPPERTGHVGVGDAEEAGGQT